MKIINNKQTIIIIVLFTSNMVANRAWLDATVGGTLSPSLYICIKFYEYTVDGLK